MLAASTRHAGRAVRPLPRRLRCESLSRPSAASPHRSRFWRWEEDDVHAFVHYEQAGDSGPALLCVPGFGVGASPHWTDTLEELSLRHRVFVIDLLGQGKSWPDRVDGLAFSADLWVRQNAAFISSVIREPAFVCGNSLGGFVAVHLATAHPQLVRGLVLLNAAPFWGAPANNLWNGVLPAPWLPSLVARVYFSILRSPAAVRALLRLVYASPSRVDDALLVSILEPTSRAAAPAVFASILFSPPPALSFTDALRATSAARVPLLALYGRDDPWVVPLWGQRLKRTRPEACYIELSPAGHCPHHEAPFAVNPLVAQWIAAVVGSEEQQQQQQPADESSIRVGLPLPNVGDTATFAPPSGGVAVVARRVDGTPRNPFEIADARRAAEDAAAEAVGAAVTAAVREAEDAAMR